MSTYKYMYLISLNNVTQIIWTYLNDCAHQQTQGK